MRRSPAPQELEAKIRRALAGRRDRQTSAPGRKNAAKKENPGSRATSGRGRALFFRNLLNSGTKELGSKHIHQGVFYIASALKRSGAPFLFSSTRISLEEGSFATSLAELDRILKEHPDINFIGLTLYDSYFKKAAELIRYLRARSRAFIAVGGLMPTASPLETLVHLPEVNFVVRGAGEEIVPRILSILGGADLDTGLSPARLEALRELDGLLFSQPGALLFSGADRINRVANLDRSELDFSLLEECDVRSGAVFALSRGCPYGCLFCSSMDKGRFTGKSPQATARLLGAYGRRLREIYGRWSRVPPAAFGIGFYDDDFLADRARAAEIFRLIRRSPFYIRFFQAATNSFFHLKGSRSTDSLDKRLLDAMPEDLFLSKVGEAAPERPHVYIGTENFCGAELKRLGKGYSQEKVERLVRELSRRRIRQAHHCIAANAHTSPEDFVENLVEIARLRASCGEYFDVLKPVIPHLCSFYGTPSYRKLLAEKNESCLKLRGRLAVKKFKEFDYPLVERDLPLDPEVRHLAEHIAQWTRGEWDEALSRVLCYLLQRSESIALKGGNPAKAAKLRRLADRYSRVGHPPPPGSSGRIFQMPKANIQIFLTRRCHLRCRYCPVKKRDADMSRDTLHRAVQLLMTHESPRVRLDFGGGEPTLRFDMVEEGLRHASALAQKHGKEVSFYMVTNAVSLSPRMLRTLKRYDVFVEMSLDGKPQDHNRHRLPHKPGLDPYRASRRGLEAAVRAGIRHSVVLVASPENCGRLFSNFKHLVGLGVRGVEINYAIGVFWSEAKSRVLFKQIERITQFYRDRLISGKLSLGNLRGRNEPALLNGELMVDTDGSLHLLSEWMFETTPASGQAAYSYGDVSKTKDINPLYWSRFHSYYMLSRLYAGDPGIRKTMLNNISLGESFGKHCDALRDRIYGRHNGNAVHERIGERDSASRLVSAA